MQQISPSSSKAAAREILDTIPPIMWFIRREMRAHRKGLSVPQFRALCMINSRPGANLSQVAEHLEASLPTASRIVAILVKKNFLARRGSSDDRRQMELVLTPEGRAVLEQGWAATQAQIEKRLGDLDPTQLRSIDESLKVFKEIFGTLGLPGGTEIPVKRQLIPMASQA